MLTLRETPVDHVDARALLGEYFTSRELGFAHQNKVYSATFPDTAVFTPPAGVFIVALDDETPVGCGGIRRVPDAPTGIRYEVKHLYLRPETRGRGWGRALLQALEDRARGWDAAEVVLDTHHSLTSAAALYRAAGYSETERFNENPNATVWLRKVL